MIELDENKKQLIELTKKVESIGDSLWLKKYDK